MKRSYAPSGWLKNPHIQSVLASSGLRGFQARRRFPDMLAAQREIYRADRPAAEKLLRVGLTPPPEGDPVEFAAWTNLARVLLNTQEVITRY